MNMPSLFPRKHADLLKGLEATSDDFDILWKEMDKLRPKTEKVYCDAAALRRLLLDHAKALEALQRG